MNVSKEVAIGCKGSWLYESSRGKEVEWRQRQRSSLILRQGTGCWRGGSTVNWGPVSYYQRILNYVQRTRLSRCRMICPPPLPVSKLTFFLRLLVWCRASLLNGEGERKGDGGGAKSFYSEKAWSFTNHSILSGYECVCTIMKILAQCGGDVTWVTTVYSHLFPVQKFSGPFACASVK